MSDIRGNRDYRKEGIIVINNNRHCRRNLLQLKYVSESQVERTHEVSGSINKTKTYTAPYHCKTSKQHIKTIQLKFPLWKFLKSSLKGNKTQTIIRIITVLDDRKQWKNAFKILRETDFPIYII